MSAEAAAAIDAASSTRSITVLRQVMLAILTCLFRRFRLPISSSRHVFSTGHSNASCTDEGKSNESKKIAKKPASGRTGAIELLGWAESAR